MRPLWKGLPLLLALGIALAAKGPTLAAVPLGSLLYKVGIEVIRVELHTQRHWSVWKLLERVFGSHAWLGQALSSRLEPGVFARFGEEMWWSVKLGAYSATSAKGSCARYAGAPILVRCPSRLFPRWNAFAPPPSVLPSLSTHFTATPRILRPSSIPPAYTFP